MLEFERSQVDARRVAKIISLLRNANFFREQLLVRLVVGGLSLTKAVSLTVEDVFDRRQEISPNEGFSHFGGSFDPFCREYHMRALAEELVNYYHNCVGSKDGDVDAVEPIFPSRKRGSPITTRTAERLFVYAQIGAGISDTMTFRDASVLGRNLRRLGGQCSEQRNAQMANILEKIEPLVCRIFKYRPFDQDDARQAVALALLRNNPYGTMSIEDATRVATTSLKDFQKQCAENSRTEVSGLLGDWSTVTNRFDAKSRHQADDSEGEEHVNKSHMRSKLILLLKTLDYREREILKLRFGLSDGYEFTRTEIGHIFRVSAERMRRIEVRALRKLQQPSRAAEVVGFLE